MFAKLKISHVSHSGRLRPHEFTSYIPLAVLMLFVGIVLIGYTASVTAADPPPQAGSVGLTGTMPAPPPKVAATITAPKDGQHFTASPVNVSGTCPDGTLIEIYKNDIFAGSTPCDSGGKFSLDIDLLYGQNVITARVYDALNQAGPVSNSVTVFYDGHQAQTDPASFLNFNGAQLILDSNAVYRGTFPGQMLNVPLTILGGTPPYAINIEWGDSSNTIISRGNNSVFNTQHTYKKPGPYKITFQGSDSHQLVAFLTVAAIVNGQPSVVSDTTSEKPNILLEIWPLYAICATLVVSFWLGERREKHILQKAGNMAPLQPVSTPPAPASPA
jgi:hypothetical protein